MLTQRELEVFKLSHNVSLNLQLYSSNFSQYFLSLKPLEAE